jgi:hypothetical protein
MLKLFMGLPLVAGLAVSGPASAMVVSAGDPTFDVFWSCGGGGGCNQSAVNLPPSPLSATGTFGNFAFSNGGTTFTMDVTIENTTPQGSLSTADWQSTRLTAIGFDTLPDATGISTTSTIYPTAVLEDTFPSFMKVDVCTSSGTQNCAGGASGGTFPDGSGVSPNSDAFTLTLTGLPSGTTSIDLGTDVAGGTELFDAKFQTGYGSFEFQNSPGSPPPPDVPEPGTLALLGSFLVVLGIASTHRHRATLRTA